MTRYPSPPAEELAAAAARLGLPLEKLAALPPSLARVAITYDPKLTSRTMVDRLAISPKSLHIYLCELRRTFAPFKFTVKAPQTLASDDLIEKLQELSTLGITAKEARKKLGLSFRRFWELMASTRRRGIKIEFARPDTFTGRILELAKQGFSARQISEMLGYPLDHTHTNISRFRRRGLLPKPTPEEKAKQGPAYLFPSEAPALAARFSVPVELIAKLSDGETRILRAYDPDLTLEQLAGLLGISYPCMGSRLGILRRKLGPLPLARKVRSPDRCSRCGQTVHRQKTCAEGA